MEVDGVRRLVEILFAFFTKGIAVEEDLTYSLTSVFLRNIQDVLFTKQLVSYTRFRYLLINFGEEMLYSPEMYLSYVFYACIQDTNVNVNIFERFLSAFAIILRMAIETRLRADVDFCQLVPDTFLVLYNDKLRALLTKDNGFRRFVEYINNPKYLKSKCVERNISSFYDPNASIDETPHDLREKAYRIMEKEQNSQKCWRFEDPDIDDCISSLAKRVLELAKPELIPILNDDDLNAGPSDLVQPNIEQIDEEKRIFKISEGDSESASERYTSLCSDSKTNDDAVVQMTDNERYENIIEAVIKHNRSKSSCDLKSKGGIQTEADQNLECMKSKIQSLIIVLDEYDKE